MNKTVIARQLEDWQILPEAQRLSELYFASVTPLPDSTEPGVVQRLTFTVRNIEHRTTRYSYQILAESADGSVVRFLGNGTLTLDHEQSQDVTHMISVPSIGDQVAVKVKLEYETMKPEGTLGTQRQSIHHWVDMTGSGHE